MNNDAVQVADDEQRRTFQGISVTQKLIVGGTQILVFSLVFPSKKASFPDIGETVATTLLGGALLKAKVFSGGISGGRRRMAQCIAEIDEVFLGSGSFFQFHFTPFGDKFGDSHKRKETNTLGIFKQG